MAWDWDKLKEQQSQRTGGPPQPPIQIDELIDRFKNSKFSGMWWLIILLIVLIIGGATTAYTVDQNEVGVIQRFGKYTRTTSPGLHFKLPNGIEKVTKVKVDLVNKEEFEGIDSMDRAGSRYASGSETGKISLMLTGDLNVAEVPWIVQYRIKDARNYLFKVEDPESTLRDLSEATMRLVVGDRSINEVITKRKEIADEAMALLQKELDEAETGFIIRTIEMRKTNVPGPVQASFNEVNQAVQEKEKMVYQAKEEYNRAVPKAKGEAERVIRGAEGYELDRVNRAQGDASRFMSLYAEYKKAPEVTRRRMYLEAMKDVLPNMGGKFIVDSDQKSLLPLLNLTGKGEVVK